ncbi:MAG: hypothetical protein V3S33_03490 [Gammaproteobacteria bacterium]
MKAIPTIEECFAVYLRSLDNQNLDPLSEDEYRRAYFCGFESAMVAIDSLAVFASENGNGERTELIWQQWRVEFEKYAASIDGGKISTNH